MKNVIFSNGQRIIKQILDFLQLSKEESIAERQQDFTEFGVVKDTLNELDIIEGDNNTPLTPSITVRTGVAHDSAADRIFVDDETLAFDATNPSDTTDNGLGSPTLTPSSTGSKNIPLTVNVNNFVWVDYLQATDETAFTLHKITNEKLFYKSVDGYIITITLVDTPPTSKSLKLGNLDLTGGGVVSPSTISKVGRVFSRLRLNRVKIKTPRTDRADVTTSYSIGEQELFLDDHVKAIGNGTITPTNPHGLNSSDIGLSPTNTVENHQKFLHTNGIEGDVSSTTSSLFGFVTSINPGFDFVTVRKLASEERVNVDGNLITPDDLSNDTDVLFSASDPSGTWYIFLDKTLKNIQKTQTNLVATPDVSKFLLFTLVFTTPGDQGAGDGDISSFTDERVFGTIGPDNFQYEKVVTKGPTGSRPTPPKKGHLFVNDELGTIDRFSGTVWESVAINLPPGTRLVFFQASAPVGWTQVTTQNDKALRIVSGAGGGSGGTTAFSAGFTLAHSHNVDSHIHSISADGSHTHTLIRATPGGNDNNFTNAVDMDAAGSHSHGGGTGGQSSGTDSQLTSSVFQFIDVIVCDKD